MICQFPHFYIRQEHMKRLENKKEEKLQKSVINRKNFWMNALFSRNKGGEFYEDCF